MHFKKTLLVCVVLLSVSKVTVAGPVSLAKDGDRGASLGPTECSPMEVWDFHMAMCMPVAMRGMPMSMAMVQGNSFFTGTFESGPRGRSAFSVPDMVMVDVGTSIGEYHYVNLDFMGTIEKWTYPSSGTPELLQIGESQVSGQPFLDAQHPHSSPIMGLTLSDTITWGSGKDHGKLWFAPRGESTDGPVAFMHRPTGQVNPQAPLGHHIGQDVGHISSTVFGGSVRIGETTLEVSTFSGSEPQPTQVDLPLGAPNSYALRMINLFSPRVYGMMSVAFVRSPEPSEPSLDHVWRYSASIYDEVQLSPEWKLSDALIWGLINGYDGASALNSFTEEILLSAKDRRFWGRLEILQRTPAELAISVQGDVNSGQWVSALTTGYTQRLANWNGAELGLGGSLTVDILPVDDQASYGGDPVIGQVFLQLSGMKMWNLN